MAGELSNGINHKKEFKHNEMIEWPHSFTFAFNILTVCISRNRFERWYSSGVLKKKKRFLFTLMKYDKLNCTFLTRNTSLLNAWTYVRSSINDVRARHKVLCDKLSFHSKFKHMPYAYTKRSKWNYLHWTLEKEYN